MNSKFTFEDVKNYLLKKMSKEQNNRIEAAFKTDKKLRELRDKIKSSGKSLKMMDSFILDKKKSRNLYNKIVSSISRPTPAKGQVWKLKDEELYVLIIAKGKEYDITPMVDVIPLTGTVYFAGPRDLIFSSTLFSHKTTAAHIRLRSRVYSKYLDIYLGDISKTALNQIGKALNEDYKKLAAGFKTGELDDAYEKEYLDWFYLIQNQLKIFGGEKSTSNKSPQKPNAVSVIKIPERDKNEINGIFKQRNGKVEYSLAGDAGNAYKPAKRSKKINVYKDEKIFISLLIKLSGTNLRLMFRFIPKGRINRFTFSIDKKIKHSVNGITIKYNVADININLTTGDFNNMYKNFSMEIEAGKMHFNKTFRLS